MSYWFSLNDIRIIIPGNGRSHSFSCVAAGPNLVWLTLSGIIKKKKKKKKRCGLVAASLRLIHCVLALLSARKQTLEKKSSSNDFALT